MIKLQASDLTTIHDSATYATGTEGIDASANKYVFLKGVASTIAGSAVAIDHDGTDWITAALTETEGAKGRDVAVAMAATVANKYGWYQVYGLAEVYCGASDAADAVQYCTATSFMIDDAGTTKLHGVHLIDTVGGAAANATCIIKNPHTAV